MPNDVIALVFILITLPFLIGMVVAVMYGLADYFGGWK